MHVPTTSFTVSLPTKQIITVCNISYIVTESQLLLTILVMPFRAFNLEPLIELKYSLN